MVHIPVYTGIMSSCCSHVPVHIYVSMLQCCTAAVEQSCTGTVSRYVHDDCVQHAHNHTYLGINHFMISPGIPGIYWMDHALDGGHHIYIQAADVAWETYYLI